MLELAGGLPGELPGMPELIGMLRSITYDRQSVLFMLTLLFVLPSRLCESCSEGKSLHCLVVPAGDHQACAQRPSSAVHTQLLVADMLRSQD